MSAPTPPDLPRVLLVDDDPAQLEMLQLWLRHDGFAVTTALGGAAGVAQLGRGPLDAVVTDLRMPGVTGLDVLRAAHEHQPGITVIVLTGQDTVAEVQAALAGGMAFAFLQKPLRNLDHLSRELRRALAEAPTQDKRP